MSKNRVEQLEATVAQLQSTVEGLTEELVESKERIRVLEAELDTDIPTRVPKRRSKDANVNTAESRREAAPDEVEEAAAEAETGEENSSGDDEEESTTDDIIVA